MEVTLLQYCIVCPLLFLAGLVDSIAGGGGVISISAYMLAGLPVHVSLGTNKAAMSLGTAVSTAGYFRAGKMDLGAALCAAVGALGGAAVGTALALKIPERALTLTMLAVLPAVAVFLAFKKDFGSAESLDKGYSRTRVLLISLCIGLVIGCYDGLIGPGTGMFLMLAFTGLLGYDLLKAAGCARMANLASGIASFLVYLQSDKVVWTLALVSGVFAIAGNALGARLALKGGVKVVRAMVFVVLGLLLLRVAWTAFA